MSKLYRCSGCNSISYCSTACQREDWPNHKITCRILQKLSTGYAYTLFEELWNEYDFSTSPEELFENFTEFMLIHTPEGSIVDLMEDYLNGFFTKKTERMGFLRTLFRNHDLAWSSKVWTLYEKWEEGKVGNRYQKMMSFLNEVRSLF